MKVRLCLWAPPKVTQGRVKYEWWRLRDNNELQERYAVEVHNRFQALTEEGESATERYGKFVKANEGAAEECMEKVPKQRKKVRVASDPRVILAREEMVKAYSVLLKDRSDTCREVVQEEGLVPDLRRHRGGGARQHDQRSGGSPSQPEVQQIGRAHV